MIREKEPYDEGNLSDREPLDFTEFDIEAGCICNNDGEFKKHNHTVIGLECEYEIRSQHRAKCAIHAEDK